MMRKFSILLFLGMLLPALLHSSDDPTQEALKKIEQHIRENDELTKNIGYYQTATWKSISDDGNSTSEETRVLKTIWLEDKPFGELIKINNRDLTAKEKADEAKRKEQFIKMTKSKSKSDFDYEWDDLFIKYKYALGTPEGDAAYVVNFTPKIMGVPERNRIEKILNRMAGRVWVDRDYNILRGSAWLPDPIRFGLGIIGKLDELEVHYTQQKWEGIWMPETFRLNYKARLLVKGRHQQLETRYYDYFRR